MTVGGVAEPWAKLRLERGDSSADHWELAGSRGETTLTVGAGPSSSWVVRGQDVKPLHFTLHWDGSRLSVADTQGAGGITVDGVPLYSEWVKLGGSARIEFGKALLLVETSSANGTASEAPGEPAPAKSTRTHKVTLMGVSPMAALRAESPPSEQPAEASPSAAEASPPAAEASPPAAEDAAEGDFRPVRGSDSERARKATLLGIAIGPTPAAPEAAQGGSPADDGASAQVFDVKPATPARGIPSGTLMGVVGPLEARVQRLAAAAVEAGKASEPRTLLELPTGNFAKGDSGRPTSAASGVVTQAEVRAISAPPQAASERIGSTWQEVPGEPRRESVPMAVRVDDDARGPRRPDPERPSQMETQVREGSAVGSRPPRRSFPLQYLGIVLLTAAAYFAWLYLLDHL